MTMRSFTPQLDKHHTKTERVEGPTENIADRILIGGMHPLLIESNQLGLQYEQELNNSSCRPTL